MKCAQSPSLPGIIILGMHRSGTSVLTQILQASGYFIGKEGDLLPPNDANAKGFGERQDVVALNEWLLMQAHPRKVAWPEWQLWQRAWPVVPHQLAPEAWAHFSASAVRIINSLQTPGSPWVMKDPRLCLTLACWLKILPSPPIVLLAHRHPQSISKSLFQRDGIPQHVALAFWETHIRSAIEASQGLIRTEIWLERLLETPQKEIAALGAFLTKHGLPPLGDASLTMISPQLIHHRNPAEEWENMATQSQKTLSTALQVEKSFERPLPPENQISNLILETNAQQLDSIFQLEGELKALRRQLEDARSALLHHQELAKHLAALNGMTFQNIEPVSASLENIKDQKFLWTGKRISTAQNLQCLENLSILENRCQSLQHLIKSSGGRPDFCRVFLLASPGTDTRAAAEHYKRENFSVEVVLRSGTQDTCSRFDPHDPAVKKIVESETKSGWVLFVSALELLYPPDGFQSISEWLKQLRSESRYKARLYRYLFPVCEACPSPDASSFASALRWYLPCGEISPPCLWWHEPSGTDPVSYENDAPFAHLLHGPSCLSIGKLKTYLLDLGNQTLPDAADLYFDDGSSVPLKQEKNLWMKSWCQLHGFI